MREHIKRRTDFSEIEARSAYIPYKPYLEAPSCEDYRDGETRSIILLNSVTGKPELIEYKLVGAVPFNSRAGYNWYWGKINATGANAELLFDFWPSGKLKQINVVFCGKSMSDETFKKVNQMISCAAEITAFGPFGTKKI